LKSKKTAFIAAIILYIASGIEAQDISLTIGKRTKTIKAGTFIQVQLPVPNQEPRVNCPINSMSGQLISYGNGKLNLLVKRSVEPLSEGNTNVGYLKKITRTKENNLHLIFPGTPYCRLQKKGKTK